MKGYLDIETSFEGAITVIGLYAEDRGLIQLVGSEVSDLNLCRILEGIGVLVTYNGTRFDLPVIRRRLGVDLFRMCHSRDLMYTCWRFGLYGGLKRVEERLGIPRRLKGLNGSDAMRLWKAYEDDGNREALALLLEYNREDVLNLVLLERILDAPLLRQAS